MKCHSVNKGPERFVSGSDHRPWSQPVDRLHRWPNRPVPAGRHRSAISIDNWRRKRHRATRDFYCSSGPTRWLVPFVFVSALDPSASSQQSTLPPDHLAIEILDISIVVHLLPRPDAGLDVCCRPGCHGNAARNLVDRLFSIGPAATALSYYAYGQFDEKSNIPFDSPLFSLTL